MVSDMCLIAGIKGKKTNHSLRATGATEFYSADVPDKKIKERTGHRSFKCLRMYERTIEKQQAGISKRQSSSKDTTFNMELKKNENTSMQSGSINSLSSMPIAMNFSNCSVNVSYNIHQVPPAPSKG